MPKETPEDRETRIDGMRKRYQENKEKVLADRKAYREKHKEELKIKRKAWLLANPQSVRKSNLRRTHGLEFDAYADHCHTTGCIRGLLCGNCNTGLGMFRDDPGTILLACLYVLRSMPVVEAEEFVRAYFK